MNAPRLKSISGVAFGSFADGFQQDLPASGLLLLDGENLETGGSSGSGKSTFIHALNYPFGTCKVPLTALQNWDIETSPSVTAVYEIDGHEVEVTRGKRFQLRIDGELQNGSAKQKEEELDKRFGLDAELRAALTYRGQRKPGLFLNRTDAEKKDFLTKVLKLTEFEAAALLGESTIKQLESEIAVLEARYSDLQVRLDQVGTADVKAAQDVLDEIQHMVSVKDGERSSLQEAIATIRAEADKAERDVFTYNQPIIDAVAIRLDALKKRVVPEAPPSAELVKSREWATSGESRLERLKKEDRERAQDIQRQRAEMNKSIQHLSRQLGAAEGIMAQKDGLLADLAALKSQKCPTCEREWEDAAAKRAEYEMKINHLDGQLADLIVAQEQMESLTTYLAEMPLHDPDPNIAKMQTALDHIRQTIATEEEKARGSRMVTTSQFAQEVAQVQLELTGLRESVRTEAENARFTVLSGIEGLSAMYDEYTRDLAALNTELQQRNYELGQARERQKEIANIQRAMSAYGFERNQKSVELMKEQDFELVRSKFLAAYFDDVLDEISRKTNDILGSIANTAHCTLQFVSEKTTQSGKVKQEIVPVVTINGHKTSLTHGPSGGMLSAIELAVDLAVGAVIAARAGTCPGWLILDESFDGLGPVEKKTCMEILQTYAHDRLVIVVDHMSETKGWFTQRVKIEYACGKSRIC